MGETQHNCIHIITFAKNNSMLEAQLPDPAPAKRGYVIDPREGILISQITIQV